MLRVTCHRSLMSTATATDPPTATTPTMHSKLIKKDQKDQKKIQMQKIIQTFQKLQRLLVSKKGQQQTANSVKTVFLS